MLLSHHRPHDERECVRGTPSGVCTYGNRQTCSIALNSDTGFERDSDRIFHPQLYFLYSKHLLKLYKRFQTLMDEIHQSVFALDARQYRQRFNLFYFL